MLERCLYMQFLTGLEVVIRLFTALLIAKFIVNFFDSSLIAIYAAHNNLFLSLGVLVSSGLYAKYLCDISIERRRSGRQVSKSFAFKFALYALISGTLLVLLYIFGISIFLTLTNYTLQDFLLEVKYVYFIFTMVPFYFLVQCYFAYNNGNGQIARLAYIKILISISTVFLSLILSCYFGQTGLIVGMVVSYLMFGAFFIYRDGAKYLCLLKVSSQQWSNSCFFGYLHSAFSVSIPAILTPLSLLYVRSYLAGTLGLESTGHWEMIWRVGDAVMVFFSSFVTVFLIPRISTEVGASNIRTYLSFCFWVALLNFVGTIVFYINPDFFVSLLYGDSYTLISSELLVFIFFGIFRALGMVAGIYLIVNELNKKYIFSEIAASLCFVSSVLLLVTTNQDFYLLPYCVLISGFISFILSNYFIVRSWIFDYRSTVS